MLRSAQSAWPVVEEGQTIGLITFDDARATLESERAAQTVREVMSPIDERLAPDLGGRQHVGAKVRAAPAIFARDADPQQTGGTKILIVLGWKASLPVDFGGTGGKFRLRKGPRLRTELRLEFGQPPAVRIEDRAVLRLRVGP